MHVLEVHEVMLQVLHETHFILIMIFLKNKYILQDRESLLTCTSRAAICGKKERGGRKKTFNYYQMSIKYFKFTGRNTEARKQSINKIGQYKCYLLNMGLTSNYI